MARCLFLVTLVLSLTLLSTGTVRCQPLEPLDPPAREPLNSEFVNLVTYLQAQEYNEFVDQLVKTGGDKMIIDSIEAGDKITILAPSNAAMEAALARPQCKKFMGFILLDHILTGYREEFAIRRIPDGTLVFTLGSNKLTKAGRLPPTFQLRRPRVTPVVASITEGNAFTGDTVIVHKVDRVLGMC